MLLYHGSENIIEQPEYGKGKLYNDYGRGFYCTEHEELAKEWACTENVSGFVNRYELDMSGLKILDLSEEKYHILHWLTLLMNHRTFDISTPIAERGKQYLNEHFFIDVESYDIIRGYRADDSYFSFAKAFLNNAISLGQLSVAMKLGKMGEQVVLKSPKAFDRIKYLANESVDHVLYYPRRRFRDEKARQDFIKLGKQTDINADYLIDIVRGEGKYERIQ